MSPKRFPSAQKLKNKRFLQDKDSLRQPKQKIAWNFHLIETEHKDYKWSIRKLTVYTSKLVKNFENKTISEIERANGNNHNHFWDRNDLNKLDPELQKILKKFGEQVQVFQFHINNKVRIWGTVEGNIFNIICLDEEHKGYKVEKKHT